MSSSKIYQPPFHRRILPWIYVAVFMVLSPILVFYTSGYRYNPKKQVIEKNGNLILDSTPKGAQVFLDDQPTKHTTPVNIQDVTPGTHTIKLELENRISWEKQLDVKAERVTFADHVILWQKNPTAELIAPLTKGFFTYTNDKEFFGMIKKTTSGTAVELRDANGVILMENESTSTTYENIKNALLADQGSSVAINEKTNTNNVFGLKPKLTILASSTQTIYPFEDQFVSEGRLFSLKNKQFENQNLNGFSLEKNTSTETSILKDSSFFDTRYQLPAGNWEIAYAQRPYILLHETINQRWLGIQIKPTLESRELHGTQLPEWLAVSDIPQALMINNNELWRWALNQQPELLIRQSQPIIKTKWHPKGQYIFFAENEGIFALDLDNRNNRNKTLLAAFDQVSDFTYSEKHLFVIGERENKTGLWKIKVE